MLVVLKHYYKLHCADSSKSDICPKVGRDQGHDNIMLLFRLTSRKLFFFSLAEGGPITMDMINKLEYTECFLKEVFRCYPPVAGIGRMITEDCTIGEMFSQIGS